MSARISGGVDWRTLGKQLSNWGRWGKDDQRGTTNLIGPDQLRAAAALVTQGRVFDLGIPLDEEGPQDGRDRSNPMHFMSVIGGTDSVAGAVRFNDDYVFTPLQGGTQWDALSHCYYDDRLYNDTPKEAVNYRGALKLGIETQAKGIVGRGVLLDVARHEGREWLLGGEGIGPELLTDVTRDENVEVRVGDILLIRTGWWRKFLEDRDRSSWILADEPGISLACCSWLRDHGVAAIASDNWALEVIPSGVPGEGFPVHMVLIRDMGMMIGEMFDLEDLAEDCKRDGVYEFLLCAPVLKVSRGVGTPVNPLALK